MSSALASTTRGAGRPIVLVHGFTQTGRSWEVVADALADQHRVTVVDLPGHGGSTARRADLWQSAALLGRTGGRATYVGYSLGARTCLHLALSDGHPVERLVLLGATAGIDDPVERHARLLADEQLAQGLERDGVDAFLDRWLALPLFAGLPEAERTGPALADRRANSADGLASSLRLAGTGTQDPPLWDRLDDVNVPVLVTAGAEDGKFSALGRRIADGIGPSASFAAIPGAGHAAHLERPGAFLKILRRWLNATDPGS